MKSDDFLKLVAAGLSSEQIAVVMEMMERDATAYAKAEETRKAKIRERVANWRDKQRNVTETLPKVTVRLTGGDAHVEDKTSNLDIEPQKEEKKQDAQARDVSDFKAEFSDLDTDHLNALIKHRRSKRASITGLSARLFREAADNCGLPLSQAVETCIDRNWITIKPDWLNKPQSRGSPPPKPRGVGGVFSDFVSGFEDGQSSDDRSGETVGSTVLSLPYRRTG